LKTLIEDNTVIFKPADKGSYVVVWDRDDYLAEGYLQLGNDKVYTKVKNFADEKLGNLVGESINKMFQDLHDQASISNDELTVLLRNILTENAFGTRPERVRNAFLNAFHLRSIFAFHSRSICVPFR
jgi:hypothetical protein